MRYVVVIITVKQIVFKDGVTFQTNGQSLKDLLYPVTSNHHKISLITQLKSQECKSLHTRKTDIINSEKKNLSVIFLLNRGNHAIAITEAYIRCITNIFGNKLNWARKVYIVNSKFLKFLAL